MEMVRAKITDIAEILGIYQNAREFMRANGNPDQWSGGYPQRELLESDISDGTLYLLKDSEEILAVFKFFVGEDPTYKTIYGGHWLNDSTYGVIHRLAAAKMGAGYAARCIEWCRGRCGSLRADTHINNLPMRRLLEKCGFARCGVIYLENGDPRIAYHLAEESD